MQRNKKMPFINRKCKKKNQSTETDLETTQIMDKQIGRLN